MISPQLANVVIAVVTLVWVAYAAMALFQPSYRGDPQIHLIFWSIVGGSMALKARRPDRNGNGPGEDGDR